MAVSEAARRVGQIAEVVACLVEHLGTVDLARAQRVSRTWRYEINRSPICQQKLFKSAVLRHEEIFYDDCPDPMGLGVFLEETEDTIYQDDEFLSPEVVVSIHPILEVNQKSAEEASGKVNFEKLSAPLAGASGEILLTQPPQSEAKLQVVYVFDEGPYLGAPVAVEYDTRIERQDYVRLHDLKREVDENFRNSQDSDFWEWLPRQYEALFADKAELPIKLDDYITSYGWPRRESAEVFFEGCIEEGDKLIVELRKQPARPDPRTGEASSKGLIRYLTSPEQLSLL
ncbi:hypothetical protein CBER1_01392 [Cercospora berteroae]|uniref:F-box domain-containing protein n=1 Tax=Cercospora berteroae TaxID=357750 RepID=A0A2S6CCC7_9PEZI|nr:hypothetical protein CBER1_01392 [Cercospora berteroae]